MYRSSAFTDQKLLVNNGQLKLRPVNVRRMFNLSWEVFQKESLHCKLSALYRMKTFFSLICSNKIWYQYMSGEHKVKNLKDHFALCTNIYYDQKTYCKTNAFVLKHVLFENMVIGYPNFRQTIKFIIIIDKF